MQISSQHLDAFLSKIEAGYSRYGNPYHNATHAADVAVTTHYFIHSLGLKVRDGTNLPTVGHFEECLAVKLARCRIFCGT